MSRAVHTRSRCVCGNGRLPHAGRPLKSRVWYLCLALELLVIAVSLACAFLAGTQLAR